MQSIADGKLFPLQRLDAVPLEAMENRPESVMSSRITDTSEQIDRNTSRSICDAVGERLQQSLRPETSRLSSHLEHLMDELRRRDCEGRLRSSN